MNLFTNEVIQGFSVLLNGFDPGVQLNLYSMIFGMINNINVSIEPKLKAFEFIIDKVIEMAIERNSEPEYVTKLIFAVFAKYFANIKRYSELEVLRWNTKQELEAEIRNRLGAF